MWCDKAVEGNSMAGRMASLIDPATEKAGANAIKIIDSHTVQLNCLASDITIIAGMADYPAAVVHSSLILPRWHQALLEQVHLCWNLMKSA